MASLQRLIMSRIYQQHNVLYSLDGSPIPSMKPGSVAACANRSKPGLSGRLLEKDCLAGCSIRRGALAQRRNRPVTQ
jgi:hypothetical protein